MLHSKMVSKVYKEKLFNRYMKKRVSNVVVYDYCTYTSLNGLQKRADFIITILHQ